MTHAAPTYRPTVALATLVLAGLCLAGCDVRMRQFRAESKYYVKPTIAVVSFQSAGSPNGWNVGGGLADVITDELVKTERFHVVERGNIDVIVQELQMQQSKLTRPEGKAPVGRLKNVEYLVKGRVTDFGHVSSNDAWARMDMLNAFGKRDQAVMRMTFQLIEVESGRIVLSRTVQKSLSTGTVTGDATYKNVGFGGSTFYRTPLGKVTADGTREAVAEIVRAVAMQPWRPQVALIQPERIIINGGSDRGVTVGSIYKAMELGQAITDPRSGDKIDYLPGRQIGQLEVVEVYDRYSVAKSMTQSTYEVGQHLEPLGK
ncbi:MAG: CsgG/HfaB family protein [Phycisphaerae bacterium]|nr:CsgG/HfaB family protein [Phycisphaerae bacterium]